MFFYSPPPKKKKILVMRLKCRFVICSSHYTTRSVILYKEGTLVSVEARGRSAQ